MAEIKIYGKLTALTSPERINGKYRQTIEIAALGKSSSNVYRIVVYGELLDMVNSLLKGKRVTTECFLNGRKYTNNSVPRFGMELVLKIIKQL